MISRELSDRRGAKPPGPDGDHESALAEAVVKMSWKKLGIGLLAVIAVVVIVLAFRAWNVGSPPTPPEAVDTGAAVDIDDALGRLAAAIRLPTISPVESDADVTPFLQTHELLEEFFPRVHEIAERRLVSDLTLHFTIPGSDADAPHVVFLAHMDVVPVEEGTEDDWSHPPFGGAVADGFLWGRGTMDNKHNMMGIMEAAEAWFAQGGRPEHTLHFVFGHDEEIGGLQGARRVAQTMMEDEVDVVAVYDEGLLITDGILPGVDDPVALVGITERGYLTVEIRAHAEGGHSSMPPQELAITRLATALQRLDADPMPAAIDGPTALMFEKIAAEMDFGHRLIFRNLWLFEPLVISQMTASAGTNAAVRTTAAPTILRAGDRENVLPRQAVATVNFRIHPRESIDEVLEYLDETVATEHISVEPVGEMQAEPSPLARLEGPGYEALERAFFTVYPDIALAPNMLTALSDSRHFTDLTSDVYRFHPITVTERDLERIHGVDERIAVDDFENLIQYYGALLRQW